MNYFFKINLNCFLNRKSKLFLLLCVRTQRIVKSFSKIFLISFIFVLLFMPHAKSQSEYTEIPSSPKYEPYSCIPSSMSLVLSYFGKKIEISDFSREFHIRDDGQAPSADVINSCKKHGLYCNAYRGLSIRKIKDYLSNGFLVVLITYGASEMEQQHAATLFGVKGDILVADFLLPLHKANLDNLQKSLTTGAISFVIGETPIPAPNQIVNFLFMIFVVCICVSSLFVIYVFYKRRTLK